MGSVESSCTGHPQGRIDWRAFLGPYHPASHTERASSVRLRLIPKLN